MASGEEDLVSSICSCFSTDSPMAAALYDAAMAYYRSYLVVGVMTDCVSKYNTSNEIKMLLESYNNIDDFKSYSSDIGLLRAKKNIVPDDALYLCGEITAAIH